MQSMPQSRSFGQVLQQAPAILKQLLVNSGCALGNILLLMGGDDSVDISFKPYSGRLLNSAAIPLPAENNEGQNA